MISKRIDISKLKVKYVLGNHTQLKCYPTPEDILYELIEDFCGRIYDELKFTDASIQRKYELSDEELDDVIQQFKVWGYIEPVISNSAYTTYKIIVNPYE